MTDPTLEPLRCTGANTCITGYANPRIDSGGHRLEN